MFNKEVNYSIDVMYDLELIIEEYFRENEKPCFNGCILYAKSRYDIANNMLSYLLQAYTFRYEKIVKYIEEGIEGRELVSILTNEFSEELKVYNHPKSIIKNRISNVKKVRIYEKATGEDIVKKEKEMILKQ